MAGRVFAICFMLALSGLLWYAALSKKGRKAAVRSVFLRGWDGPLTPQTREDMPTFDGLVMGLGVVFGLFLDILALLSIIELFKRGN